MAESEGSGRELVHDGRVALVVVAVVVAVSLQAELVQVDGVPAQHSRQEFIPSDVLQCEILKLGCSTKLDT